jgi:hypothetical protein
MPAAPPGKGRWAAAEALTVAAKDTARAARWVRNMVSEVSTMATRGGDRPARAKATMPQAEAD